MKIPFLDLALTNSSHIKAMQDAACQVIASGRYLRGEHTAALEKNIATLCQTTHCVAVSNGLDALRLILRAYIELGQLQACDEVIVPANTYIATVLAISDNGLKPVLCDISDATLNLDSTLLADLITPRTRAIMPVHLYGTPCCDTLLLNIARQHNLLIIEDNAQAIGALSDVAGIHGTKATGSLGHAGAISFYPTKNLGALGDAGAVTTNDSRLADAVRALANYGSDRRYHNIYRGLNCRIDELQAAMLNVKLPALAEENERRARKAAAYEQAITNPLVTTPRIFANMTQVWHQYVVRVGNGKRDAFREYLSDCGIGTDIHYATPPHRQPCYADMAQLHFPRTEALAAEAVSLPIAEHVTLDDVAAISAAINAFGG